MTADRDAKMALYARIGATIDHIGACGASITLLTRDIAESKKLLKGLCEMLKELEVQL